MISQLIAEAISRLIKERITPLPQFILTPVCESGKYILILTVASGRSTPYYYKADGIMEAYIRILYPDWQRKRNRSRLYCQ